MTWSDYLNQGYVPLWENNMEKTSHNQMACLKCFERVCVNRIQLVQHLNDFLLQAQWFVDEHQEGHSRNWRHVTEVEHGRKGWTFLHVPRDKFALFSCVEDYLFLRCFQNVSLLKSEGLLLFFSRNIFPPNFLLPLDKFLPTIPEVGHNIILSLIW